jgi:hypothetical protein
VAGGRDIVKFGDAVGRTGSNGDDALAVVERDVRSGDGSVMRVGDTDTQIGSENGGCCQQEKKEINETQGRPPLHAKGVVVAFAPVSWLGESYGSCGLPMRMHSGRQLCSLTVARQRGIFTRFPVHDERHGRANERLRKNIRVESPTGNFEL